MRNASSPLFIAILCSLILPAFAASAKGNSDAKLNEAIQAYTDKRYHHAEDLLNEVVANDPTNQNAHLMLARTYEMLLDPKAATEEYKNCFKINPFSPTGRQAKQESEHMAGRAAAAAVRPSDDVKTVSKTVDTINKQANEMKGKLGYTGYTSPSYSSAANPLVARPPYPTAGIAYPGAAGIPGTAGLPNPGAMAYPGTAGMPYPATTGLPYPGAAGLPTSGNAGLPSSGIASPSNTSNFYIPGQPKHHQILSSAAGYVPFSSSPYVRPIPRSVYNNVILPGPGSDGSGAPTSGSVSPAAYAPAYPLAGMPQPGVPTYNNPANPYAPINQPGVPITFKQPNQPGMPNNFNPANPYSALNPPGMPGNFAQPNITPPTYSTYQSRHSLRSQLGSNSSLSQPTTNDRAYAALKEQQENAEKARNTQEAANNLESLMAERQKTGSPKLRALGTNLFVRYYGSHAADGSEVSTPPPDPMEQLKARQLRLNDQK